MDKTAQLQNRYPGVDLAKVVAISLVVVFHISSPYTGIKISDSLPLTKWLGVLVNSFSCSCIDIFALATGFLCVTSTYRYSRIAALWLTVVFWGGVISMLSLLSGCPVSMRHFVDALLPVLRMQYWYFTAYFMLFIFMPLINAGIHGLSAAAYRRVLVAIGVFVCGYSCLGIAQDRFHVNSGFSFLWLAMVYLFGAYIRLHCHRTVNPLWCLLGAVAMALMSCSRQLLALIVGRHIPGDTLNLVSYVSPFTFGVAILLFLACLNLRINTERTCILLKKMSACAFGIYLIHVHPFLFHNFWIPKMQKVNISSFSGWFAIVSLGSLAVLLMCGALEFLRIRLFDLLHINSLVRRIDTLIPPVPSPLHGSYAPTPSTFSTPLHG